MNIEGLDYNTQREKLVLPEYGREVQKMVDYAISLPTKEERQLCAEVIIDIMAKMAPQNRESSNYKQKLWDHLAIMSGFKLDIDYPFDVSNAMKIATKPEPLGYPMKKIPVRHYGNMLFEMFEKLKAMPEGEERDELARITANQMKHNLTQWSHGANDDEKVVADLAQFTDGVIQIDASNLRNDRFPSKDQRSRKKK